MVQTSDPETLVIHQKFKQGNNPKNFKQPCTSLQIKRVSGRRFEAVTFTG
jgi:hypothetical protein